MKKTNLCHIGIVLLALLTCLLAICISNKPVASAAEETMGDGYTQKTDPEEQKESWSDEVQQLQRKKNELRKEIEELERSLRDVEMEIEREKEKLSLMVEAWLWELYKGQK